MIRSSIIHIHLCIGLKREPRIHDRGSFGHPINDVRVQDHHGWRGSETNVKNPRATNSLKLKPRGRKDIILSSLTIGKWVGCRSTGGEGFIEDLGVTNSRRRGSLCSSLSFGSCVGFELSGELLLTSTDGFLLFLSNGLTKASHIFQLLQMKLLHLVGLGLEKFLWRVAVGSDCLCSLPGECGGELFTLFCVGLC